jgi:S1-C subfamily serine protease
MALIPQVFLDTVVAIGFAPKPGDPPMWAATGFLYGKAAHAEVPIYTVALVTNKHVFDHQKRACLRFNPEGGESARHFWVDLVDGSGIPLWATDPAVDLAVVAIRVDQLVEKSIQIGVFRSDLDVWTLADAEKAGVSEGDGIFVLGFPLGLVGENRNYVIVRQGAIARIRDAYASASGDILIDATVFPGNSGGPVLTRPEVVSVQGTAATGRCALLGVISSYVPYRDIAVSPQTGRTRVVFEENSGLASVIPIDHVVRLFDDNLKEWERRGVATAGPVIRNPKTAALPNTPPLPRPASC